MGDVWKGQDFVLAAGLTWASTEPPPGLGLMIKDHTCETLKCSLNTFLLTRSLEGETSGLRSLLHNSSSFN